MQTGCVAIDSNKDSLLNIAGQWQCISHMQPATRRAWINILEMAVSGLRDRPSREEIRQQNEENRQRTITDFVDVQPQAQPRPRRRNIAREGREQANR
eukprot:scaffold4505_cov84-Skeletonema_dohrnii-CCMP3373.AAC.6